MRLFTVSKLRQLSAGHAAKRKRLIARVAGFLLFTALVNAAPAPISVVVNPTVGLAPLNARVKVTIPQDPVNRIACLIADGPDYYRSSCWELAGGASPITTWISLVDLPEGEYLITASLEQVDHHLSVASTHISVKGFEN